MKYFGSNMTPGIILWFWNRAALTRIDHKAGCAYAQSCLQGPSIREFCQWFGVKLTIMQEPRNKAESTI